MHKVRTTAELYPDEPEPGDWTVWSLDSHGDGTFYLTTFSGPDAELRAQEYAEWKYERVRPHEPDQRSYQDDQRSAGDRARL